MANTKKKNNVQITSVKSDNEVLKGGVETTVVNKKPRQTKKKNVADDNKKVVKNNTKKKTTTKKNVNKTTTKKNTVNKTPKTITKEVVAPVIETSVLTPEEIIAKRKERNRKKYEKSQKKYRDNQEKKKIVVEDRIEEVKEQEYQVETKVVTLDEEDLVKKIIPIEENNKELERKEKRKTNRKTSGFTQTLTNIKELSVNKINDVREKTNDNTIPLGKSIEEQTKRSKRLIKEAIVYAIILTIINVLCIVIFDYFNFLRLFDVKWLNVVVTIIISLIFNFFVAFMVDYFVTNVWLVKRRKKKDGEQDGNNWANRKERRKNIENKEGE